MNDKNNEPTGEIMVRTLAMPADTNPMGDIFGGWLLSQMDIAGGIYTQKLSLGRMVTVAVDSMTFHKPLFVGDTLCCYCHLIKKGRTSIAVKIEAWASRQFDSSLDNREKITEGVFTYVHVNGDRKPVAIKEEKS
jgi:acyl-CoA thioesterase YciA